MAGAAGAADPGAADWASDPAAPPAGVDACGADGCDADGCCDDCVLEAAGGWFLHPASEKIAASARMPRDAMLRVEFIELTPLMGEWSGTSQADGLARRTALFLEEQHVRP